VGIVSDFQLVQLDNERNKGNPVIVEVLGTQERLAGGKHVSTTTNIIGRVRGVAVTNRGTRNMKPGEDGIRFAGTREFQVRKKDLVALGITDRDEKNMRVYHSNMVYRVTGQSWLDREKIVRLFTERTRDDYPVFTAKWDFEGDTVGVAPANCTVTVPTGTTAAVATDGATKVVAMTNAATLCPQVSVDVLDVIEGPAITIGFDFKITGAIADDMVGAILLGGITDIANIDSNVLLYMVIERVAGMLHLKDLTGAIFDTTFTASSWVRVDVLINARTHILSIVVDDVVLVDDLDVSAITAVVKHVLFVGHAASAATIKFDNVEVDCIAR